MTAGEVHRAVLGLAAGLQELGIGEGDVVAMVMSSGVDFLLVWIALTEIGAVAAPINTSLRGPLLCRILERIEPAALVVTDRYVENLDVATSVGRCPDRFIVSGQPPTSGSTNAIRAMNEVTIEGAEPRRAQQRRNALGMLMFTSGTSASVPSACMYSNEYILAQGSEMVGYLGVTADDVFFASLPMFHVVGSTLMVVPALLKGAVFAPAPRFDPVNFWDEARAVGGTIFSYVGSTLTELWKQPIRQSNADNPIRTAFGVPVPPWARAFEERFGLVLRTNYGMNEIVLATYDRDGVRPGVQRAGLPRPGLQIAIVDDEDKPVATGEIGEIVARPAAPRNMFDGYYRETERTVAAFGNLWFHTGDLGMFDSDGVLFYEGRKKDMIRRKGENVSPTQVEDALVTHDGVIEAAVYGVPDDDVEEEVVAVVVRRDNSLSGEALVAYLEALLPRNMIPRFIRFVPQLPKSASNKVEKFQLSRDGVPERTFDARTLTTPHASSESGAPS